MDTLRHKTLQFIEEQALIKRGETVVVALSGGADSVALLDVLAHLPGFGLQLVVAHLNHRLRGEEANTDELFCRTMAARYGVPFECSRVDIAAAAAAAGMSLEEAGREIRYAFFRKVAKQYAATCIAVGHHGGDQAETLLMRLLRGAGGGGLAGMKPVTGTGRIVRPLLFSTRDEIERNLRNAGLLWREDSSNRDVRFFRNRVRHELMPLLERYNPGMIERLQRTAMALAADEELLESMTTVTFKRIFAVSDREASAELADVIGELPAMRMRLYRRALKEVRGDLCSISSAHLTAIDRLVHGHRPNSEVTLPGDARAMRAYGTLRITRNTDEALPSDFELTLDKPGAYRLPCGSVLAIEISGADAFAESPANTDLIVAAGQLSFPFQVRYFRNGDRFIPLGMHHRKKLKNLFIDRKIPLAMRKRVPLLIAGGEIVWVCGIQASERVRSIGVGTEVVRLRLFPGPGCCGI